MQTLVTGGGHIDVIKLKDSYRIVLLGRGDMGKLVCDPSPTSKGVFLKF